MSLSGGSGFQSTKVMPRSWGVGANTSTASAFVALVLVSAVTSNSNKRHAPAILAAVAICFPFSHTLARKLMPSNPSHRVLLLYSAGIQNSVRYHHDLANGLSSGRPKFEKFRPMPYVVPGIWRRFMPAYGSGYTLSRTSALSTVEGSVALCHPSGL